MTRTEINHGQIEREELARIISILKCAARFGYKTGETMAIRLSLFDSLSGNKDRIHIVSSPCCRQSPSELVHIYVDDLDIYDFLRIEIEPVIIGVGLITIEEISDGISLRIKGDCRYVP